jgi:hypothetical protein
MRLVHLIGLVALVPAALNASPVAAHSAVSVPLCTGDGVARTVSLPVGPQDVPGKQVPGCCVKGCHTGGERKRGKRCC